MELRVKGSQDKILERRDIQRERERERERERKRERDFFFIDLQRDLLSFQLSFNQDKYVRNLPVASGKIPPR